MRTFSNNFSKNRTGERGKMKLRRIIGCCMCCFMAFCLVGCGYKSDQKLPDEGIPRQLSLCVGDTYNFSAVDLSIEKTVGECLMVTESEITALSSGSAMVMAKDKNEIMYHYEVRVFQTARELGGNFNLDRGMFSGKKAIVFGDSITDGYMGNETNYSETYFALLCDYLGIESDPADLLNTNFACGGTTLTYGRRLNYGISGVERVTITQPCYDTGRERDPYSNIPDADFCVIFYGTNDFDENVPAKAEEGSSITDMPVRAEDALTIKGGAYYMINQLHRINPQLKILVLPPVYRRKAGNLEYVTGDRNDIYNTVSGIKLSEYGVALREAAEENGAKFIDWYHVFTFENFAVTSQYTVDGLHPNRDGHRLMFEFLISNI